MISNPIPSLLVACWGILAGTPAVAQGHHGKQAMPMGHTAVAKSDSLSKEAKEVVVPDLSTLLAGSLADKKTILDYATIMNQSVGCGSSRESLEFPAMELYGEDSWTKFVNPFAGKKVDIPSEYEISCKDFAYPLDGMRRVNSGYGYRRRFRRMHQGIDLKLQMGDTVRSCFDGRVRIVDFERRGFGNYVVVRHANGLETVYGHLSKHSVREGDIVRAGDPIGLGGNTGRSTGPHLHLEMRFMGIPINPAQIVDFETGLPHSETYAFSRQTARSAGKSRVARSGGGGAGSDIKVIKIRKGDTLGKIARQNGTTVRKLCQLNGISTRTTLRVGRSLRVSN